MKSSASLHPLILNFDCNKVACVQQNCCRHLYPKVRLGKSRILPRPGMFHWGEKNELKESLSVRLNWLDVRDGGMEARELLETMSSYVSSIFGSLSSHIMPRYKTCRFVQLYPEIRVQYS